MGSALSSAASGLISTSPRPKDDRATLAPLRENEGEGENASASASANNACHECGARATTLATLAQGARRSLALCSDCGERARRGETPAMQRGAVIVDRALVEYALVDADTWALTCYHGPGNMRVPGLWLYNRTVVLRVRGSGSGSEPDFLVALNPGRFEKTEPGGETETEPLGALLRLSRRTKCAIKYVASLDAAHNLYLVEWAARLARASPATLVLYPKGRIDREVPALASVANARGVTDASPEVLELARSGLVLRMWRGVAERDPDRNGRPRGTADGILAFFPATKTLYVGPHFVWIDGPTRSAGHAFAPLVGYAFPPAGARAIPFVATKGMLTYPVWDLEAFRRGLRLVTGQDSLPWEFITDFHVAPNYLAARDAFEPSLRAAYAHVLAGDDALVPASKRVALDTPDVTGEVAPASGIVST